MVPAFEDENPYAAPKARVRQPRHADADRPLATRLSRLFAILIDSLLLVALVLPVLLLMPVDITADGEIDFSGGFPQGLAVSYALMGVYSLLQLVLLWTRSQTVGKIVMRIRIDEHHRAGRAGPIKTVLIRGFVVGLISSLPIVGIFFILLNPLFIFGRDKRCLHDLLAGTVVREAP